MSLHSAEKHLTGSHHAGGTSEWSAQQLTEAWAVARRLNLIGPAFEQPEYSLLARDKVRSHPCAYLMLHGCLLWRGATRLPE